MFISLAFIAKTSIENAFWSNKEVKKHKNYKFYKIKMTILKNFIYIILTQSASEDVMKEKSRNSHKQRSGRKVLKKGCVLSLQTLAFFLRGTCEKVLPV